LTEVWTDAILLVFELKVAQNYYGRYHMNHLRFISVHGLLLDKLHGFKGSTYQDS